MLLALIWTLFKIVLLLVGVVISCYAIREFRVYLSVKYWRDQGAKVIYTPILGYGLIYAMRPESKDQLDYMMKVMEENKDQPLLAFNNSKTTNCSALLLDDELIREFFVKELDYTYKIEFFKHSNFGFFFENGQKVTEARANYAKFFNFENLSALSTIINQHLHQIMTSFKANRLPDEDFHRIDVKDVLKDCFAKVVNSIIFGENIEHKVDGKDLPVAIQDFMNKIFSVSLRPLNLLTLDYLHDLKIFSESRECEEYKHKIEDKCWEVYQSRIKSGPKSIPNLLDLLVAKNKENIAEGKPSMSKKEITGHFIVMQFAGIDTSMEITSSSIVQMSRDQKLQSEFYEIVHKMCVNKKSDEPFVEADIQENELLEQYANEFIRLNNPVATTSPRRFFKPCKIGKWQFRAGDSILVPVVTGHTFSKYWDRPYEFDHTRFSKENIAKIKKGSLLPFSMGKRNCIGKALGEIMVKSILANFTRQFETKEDPNFGNGKRLKLVYGYAQPTVLAKRRIQ